MQYEPRQCYMFRLSFVVCRCSQFFSMLENSRHCSRCLHLIIYSFVLLCLVMWMFLCAQLEMNYCRNSLATIFDIILAFYKRHQTPYTLCRCLLGVGTFVAYINNLIVYCVYVNPFRKERTFFFVCPSFAFRWIVKTEPYQFPNENKWGVIWRWNRNFFFSVYSQTLNERTTKIIMEIKAIDLTPSNHFVRSLYVCGVYRIKSVESHAPFRCEQSIRYE